MKREARNENYKHEQRREPDEAVPEKAGVVDPFSIEKFREQIAAEAHEQRHAAVPLVDDRRREEAGHVFKRHRLRVNEMPFENQQGGKRP